MYYGSVSAQVDVDIDDFIDDIPTTVLIKELGRRNEAHFDESMNPDDIAHKIRKMYVCDDNVLRVIERLQELIK